MEKYITDYYTNRLNQAKDEYKQQKNHLMEQAQALESERKAEEKKKKNEEKAALKAKNKKKSIFKPRARDDERPEMQAGVV